jgi:SAM-dependent methyltransferase
VAGALKRAVPVAVRRRIRRRVRRVWPPVGFVRFGSLRRLTPISRRFGGDRGLPIDRYYIEHFLDRHGGRSEYVVGDIHGRVLEVGDAYYVHRFGDRSRIEQVDVLHVDESNPQATIVGDLTRPETVPRDAFDCVICTQTLLLIYDVHAAVGTLHAMLKPGGVALVTVPGISQLCRPDVDLWGDYWRFTTRSARRLFEEHFPPENVTVEAYGNVLTAISFLHGLAAEDLRKAELDLRDPDFEVSICVRAVKPAA